MQPLAEFVMRGRWHASVVVGCFAAIGWFLAILSPMQPLLLLFAIGLGFLSSAALSLSVLRRGAREGCVVLVFAICIWMALFTTLKVGLDTAAVTVPIWVTICAASMVLRTTSSQGAMLVSIAALVGCAVAVSYLTLGDLSDWLEQQVTENPELMKAMAGSGLTEKQARIQLRMMPFAMTVIATFGIVATTLLGRWWQSLLYNPGGFRQEFHSLRLPRGMLGLFAVLLLTQVIGGEAALEVLAVLLALTGVLYLFQGLAVMHFRTLNGGLSQFWLVGLYAFLFLATMLTVPLIVLTGVSDAIFDLRREIKS